MYPDKISLAGAKLHDNGGATIPELIEAHDHIEVINIAKGKEYEAMDWAVFQGLHKTAKQLLRSCDQFLVPTKISYQVVLDYYQSNIKSINELRESNAT